MEMKDNVLLEISVDTLNRLEEVSPDETIKTDFPALFTTKGAIESIHSIDVYKRIKEECPFNRGNWIIDIFFKNGYLQCLKHPLSSSEENIHRYLRPLVDEFNKFKMRNTQWCYLDFFY